MNRFSVHRSGWWLALVLWAAAGAQSPSENPYLTVHRNGDVAIRAGFEPDATDVYLGEPIFLTFVIGNEGTGDFTFVTGGDYRGSNRPNSFWITAVSADGKAVRDANPRGYDNMGGMAEAKSLPTGTQYRERLFLPLWCAFTTPGDYVITCRRTLQRGHRADAGKPVEVVTTWRCRVRPHDEAKQGRLITELGQRVHGATADERREAVQALAAMRDARTVPHLAAAVIRDEDRTARLAVDGLSQLKSEAAADALALALRSRDYSVAKLAATGLKGTGQADRVLGQLLRDLENEDPAIRLAAAQTLGPIRSPEARGPLAKLLQEEMAAGNGVTACAVAEALAQVADPGTDAVLQACLNGPDFSVRLAAAKGIQLSGRPIESQWLVPVIRGHSEPQFHEALQLLRVFGGPGSLRAILECVDLNNPRTDAPRTMYLLLAGHHMAGGPQLYYRWQSDPNRAGNPGELAGNREVLAELRRWLEGPEDRKSQAAN